MTDERIIAAFILGVLVTIMVVSASMLIIEHCG